VNTTALSLREYTILTQKRPPRHHSCIWCSEDCVAGQMYLLGRTELRTRSGRGGKYCVSKVRYGIRPPVHPHFNPPNCQCGMISDFLLRPVFASRCNGIISRQYRDAVLWTLHTDHNASLPHQSVNEVDVLKIGPARHQLACLPIRYPPDRRAFLW
jgi:hypothetical protein